MIKDIKKKISNLFSSRNTSRSDIRPLVFHPAMFAGLMAVGLALAVPSGVSLVNSAVPLSWERVAGVVSEVSRNEAVSGKEYSAVVIYDLNGKSHSIREEYLRDRPSRNDQVAVYYNPNDPTEAMVQKGGSLSFLAWVPLLIGLGVIAIAVIRQYVATRRILRIRKLTSKGRAVPSYVTEAKVDKDTNFIRNLFYRNYIFFKLQAAPKSSADSQKHYESEMLIWRSKMYGDVDSLKDHKASLIAYVGEGGSYYLEPPKFEAEQREADKAKEEAKAKAKAESEVAGKEPVLKPLTPLVATAHAGEDSDTGSPVPMQSMSLAQSPDTNIQPNAVDSESPVSGDDSVQSPAPMSVDIESEEDLKASDIDELEKSLAGIGGASAPIDLNFEDDPENINNQPSSPQPVKVDPLPSSIPSVPTPTPSPIATPTPTLPQSPVVSAPEPSPTPIPIGDPTPALSPTSTPTPTPNPVTPSEMPDYEDTPTITGVSTVTDRPVIKDGVDHTTAPTLSGKGVEIKPITKIEDSVVSSNPPVSTKAPVSTPSSTPPTQQPQVTVAPLATSATPQASQTPPVAASTTETSVVAQPPIITPTQPTPETTAAPAPAQTQSVVSRQSPPPVGRRDRRISVPRR